MIKKIKNKNTLLKNLFNRLGFLTIGVFVTSCYFRNFLAIDLLKKPVKILGKPMKKKVVFITPSWLPINDCFLKINNNKIHSKIKDITLPKNIVRKEKNNIFVLDLSTLGIPSPINAELTYFPWYRFATEPMFFNAIENPNLYISQSILHSLKSIFQLAT